MFTAHRFTSCSVDGLNLKHDFNSCSQSHSLNKLSTLQPCPLPSTLQTYLLLLKAVSFSWFAMLRGSRPELCRTPRGLAPSCEALTGPVQAAGKVVCISHLPLWLLAQPDGPFERHADEVRGPASTDGEPAVWSQVESTFLQVSALLHVRGQAWSRVQE